MNAIGVRRMRLGVVMVGASVLLVGFLAGRGEAQKGLHDVDAFLPSYQRECGTADTSREAVLAVLADEARSTYCKAMAAANILPTVGRPEDAAVIRALIPEVAESDEFRFPGQNEREVMGLVYAIATVTYGEDPIIAEYLPRWMSSPDIEYTVAVAMRMFCEYADKQEVVRNAISDALNSAVPQMVVKGILGAQCSRRREYVPRLIELLDHDAQDVRLFANGMLPFFADDIVASCGSDFTGSRRAQCIAKWRAWWESQTHNATVDCDPKIISRKSGGRWLTCYIELDQDPYRSDPIASIATPGAISLGTVPAVSEPQYGWVKAPQPHDNDGDGIPEYMAKFDRKAVVNSAGQQDEVTTELIGDLADGGRFSAQVVLRFR